MQAELHCHRIAYSVTHFETGAGRMDNHPSYTSYLLLPNPFTKSFLRPCKILTTSKNNYVLLGKLFLFPWMLRLRQQEILQEQRVILATHFCAFLYFCTRTSRQQFQFGCEHSSFVRLFENTKFEFGNQFFLSTIIRIFQN